MFSANSSSIENTTQGCEEMHASNLLKLLPHTCFDPTPFGAAATVPAASAATTGFSFGASKPAATTTATATAAASTSGEKFNSLQFDS